MLPHLGRVRQRHRAALALHCVQKVTNDFPYHSDICRLVLASRKGRQDGD